MGLAYITTDIGKGLFGGSCEGTAPENPVMVFGKPFGHAFESHLFWLLENCNNCSIHLPTTEFNVNSLSSQHEIPLLYFRAYGGTDTHDGDPCSIHITWKKGSKIIYFTTLNFTWYDTYDYYHGYSFIGWTPCWCWFGGNYYYGQEEITEEGSDFSVSVKFYNNGSFLSSSTEYFSVINLQHTKIYWQHIQNYAGDEIDSLFGMKASSYVHDLGDDIYITAAYQQKYLERSDSMYVDGMEGTVNLKIYHSGYVKQTRTRDDVVDKDINGPFDFTGDDYLQASVEGIVKDEDNNPVENANVWATNVYNNKYGCKTSIDGKYALPLHTKGSFSIRATKNNFNVASCSGVSQSSKHPLTVETRNFTDSNCLTRMTGYPTGEFAHLNTLAVDNQSVIIPDDPVTGDGNLIKPYNVATSIIKIKTHKWGTGASQSTTSTGTYDSSTGYGSGGFNYGGDMGDAEEWEEEEE